MFYLKNVSDKPQQGYFMINGVVIGYGLNPNEQMLLDERYRIYFEQNEVPWAAILPEIVESIGKPVLDRPRPVKPRAVKKSGRPRQKRGVK